MTKLRFSMMLAALVVPLAGGWWTSAPPFASATLALAPPKGGKGVVPDIWHLDYPAARARARQLGKPLFVVFRCEK
jgi:hypothetical protein